MIVPNFIKIYQKVTQRKSVIFLISIMMFFILIIISSFTYNIFYIPSYSMEATLSKGDVILSKKLRYHNNDRLNNNRNGQKISKTAFRSLTGSSISRNDIIIFNGAQKNNPPLIKRCIGLPGETIRIDSSKVYIENELVNNPDHSLQLYQLESSLFEEYEKTISLYSSYNFRKGDSVVYTLQNSCKDCLRSINNDLLASKYFEKRVISLEDSELGFGGQWSIDFYGPIRIPEEGMQIILDSCNVQRYMQTIEFYEGVDLDWENNFATVNGEVKSHFVFKNDYFFVLGDNRHNSRDSRFIGFVPEDKIFGKAKRVLVSVGDGGINWQRFMLKIH